MKFLIFKWLINKELYTLVEFNYLDELFKKNICTVGNKSKNHINSWFYFMQTDGSTYSSIDHNLTARKEILGHWWYHPLIIAYLIIQSILFYVNGWVYRPLFIDRVESNSKPPWTRLKFGSKRKRNGIWENI